MSPSLLFLLQYKRGSRSVSHRPTSRCCPCGTGVRWLGLWLVAIRSHCVHRLWVRRLWIAPPKESSSSYLLGFSWWPGSGASSVGCSTARTTSSTRSCHESVCIVQIRGESAAQTFTDVMYHISLVLQNYCSLEW